jgi:hypothetical protein
MGFLVELDAVVVLEQGLFEHVVVGHQQSLTQPLVVLNV